MKTPIQKFIEHMRENSYWIGNDLVDKYWELIAEEKDIIDKAYLDGIKDVMDAVSSDHPAPLSNYYSRIFEQ